MRWYWIGWWLPIVACVSRDDSGIAGASSEGGDTMLSASERCAAAPPAAEGFAIDVAGWSPPAVDEAHGEWEGGCTVANAEAGSTTLDCSLDPSGPPSIGLSFAFAESDPPWQAGDAIDVAYHLCWWHSGAEYLSLRSADGNLLLALAHGVADGPHPELERFIAPLTFDEHAAYCGDGPDPGEILPFRITFVGLDGDAHHLLQGDQAIAGPQESRYAIELYQAEIGDGDEVLTGRFIDLVVQRLP